MIRINIAYFTKKIVFVMAHAESSSLLANKIKNEIINTGWNKQHFDSHIL